MFRDQYLTSLRERPIIAHNQPRVVVHRSPNIGEIVQVKDENHSRAHWRVGIISALLPSHDGNTRTARITLPSGLVLTRSISHLYPLEIDDRLEVQKDLPQPPTMLHQKPPAISPAANDSQPEAHLKVAIGDDTTPTQQPRRPPRMAAAAAKEKIRKWTSQLLVHAPSTPDCHQMSHRRLTSPWAVWQ
uniref:DUF5641 domain-containing protein n=1 Tax=Lygus hesperus TaxID=30085 RepID=A0A0A9ZE20_LYGHE